MHGEPRTETHSSLPSFPSPLPPWLGLWFQQTRGSLGLGTKERFDKGVGWGSEARDGSRLKLPTSSGKGCTSQRGAYSHSVHPPTFPLGSKL